MTLRDRLSHLASALTLAPLAPVTKQDVTVIPTTSTAVTVQDGPAPEIKRETNPVALLPKGWWAVEQFFSPDGGRTMYELSSRDSTAVAFVAYWYVAVRWRAQKIAEAPLMVVKEDQKSGNEEWVPKHELVDVLDQPSDDYDMGELLERTSRYLDDTAECIWVKDSDTIGRVSRLTPFKRGEFSIESSETRLYDIFVTQTSKGPVRHPAEDVCYFRDSHEGWTSGGKSRLDVAMSWLRLGEASRSTIKDLLNNAVWPSAVVIPDKDWNPDPDTFERYKAELEAYAQPGQRGRPFIQLGGGNFKPLSASIKDLVPTDVLDRVESVVAAISGVPAIVLQYQVGLENSPWSQMAQARRMAYDDTIIPTWRKLERVMTRSILRPIDDDTTHFIRFDKSQIDALKRDQLQDVQIATMMGRAASLNERRTIMGLEPVPAKDDPEGRADEIPELVQPSMAELLAGTMGKDHANDAGAIDDDTDPEKKPPTLKPKDKSARLLLFVQRKQHTLTLAHALQDEAAESWEASVLILLGKDRSEIITIVKALLTEATHKSIDSKARGKASVMRAIEDYLKTDSKRSWIKTLQPMFIHGAERSTAVASADMGLSYNLLHPNAIKFAQREVAKMLTSTTSTTKQLVNDILSGGLQENRSTQEIAHVIQDATGFSKARSQLIARTESTTIFSGAPVESLITLGNATGRIFLKTWFGVMDAKERDEHVAMEGETVAIDAPFSNGVQYPSEPNCRCHVLTHEAEEDA